MEEADNTVVENANFRGVRSGRKFYSKEEDLEIIHYLLQNRRYQEVKGRALWQVIIVGVNRILVDNFMFLVDGGEECGGGENLAQYEGKIFKSDKESNKREDRVVRPRSRTPTEAKVLRKILHSNQFCDKNDIQIFYTI